MAVDTPTFHQLERRFASPRGRCSRGAHKKAHTLSAPGSRSSRRRGCFPQPQRPPLRGSQRRHPLHPRLRPLTHPRVNIPSLRGQKFVRYGHRLRSHRPPLTPLLETLRTISTIVEVLAGPNAVDQVHQLIGGQMLHFMLSIHGPHRKGRATPLGAWSPRGTCAPSPFPRPGPEDCRSPPGSCLHNAAK